MIRCNELPNGGVEIIQEARQPIVYLDTWALNCFSAEGSLRNSFISSLNKNGGSLAFSRVSIYEVENRRDKKQISKIHDLVNSAEVVYIEPRLFKVMEKEKNGKNNAWLNPGELKYIHSLNASSKQLKTSDMFSAIAKNINILKQEVDYKEINYKLERNRNDEDHLSAARKRFSNKRGVVAIQFPHATGYLWQKCYDFILIDERISMPDKEWLDVEHIIVSTAHCNFVLMDRRWSHFIQCTGLKPPQIARVYIKKQIERFLTDLEEFRLPNP